MRGYSLNFRDSALYEAYKEILEEGYSGCIYQKLINTPAPSFFASERLAIAYVRSCEQGHPMPKLSRQNREKYEEIYRRYLKKKVRKPHLDIKDIVQNIIISPAPRFYITQAGAKQIITKIRYENRRRKQTQKRIL